MYAGDRGTDGRTDKRLIELMLNVQTDTQQVIYSTHSSQPIAWLVLIRKLNLAQQKQPAARITKVL